MKKRIISCAVLVLLLSACAQPPKPIVFTKPEKGIFEAPIGSVASPDSSITWTQNNLTMIRNEQPLESTKGTTKIMLDSLQIDGLKNDAVESKINKLISAKTQELTKYAEFKNLPVSQGFYVKYPQDTSVVKSLSIGIYDTYNFNNLLGLKLTAFVAMSDNALDQGVYIENAMTIDLNTGDEIHLSDLFINGYDFEKTLNTAVLLDASSKTDESEDEYATSYTYRGGFSGIRSDVGFFLNYNVLDLIFDATYPEFDSGFSPTFVEIPLTTLKDGLAFGQRFLSEESLFTDTKIIWQNNYLYMNDETITHYLLNDIPVTSTISINSQITGDWLAMTKRLVNEDQKTLDAISRTNVAAITYEVSAHPVGQYMRLSRKFSSGTADFTDRFNTEKASMVKADGSILTLEDLFIASFDYETVIKKVLAEFLATTYSPDESGMPSIDEAFKSLNLVLGYGYFELYNTQMQPPDFQKGQIDLSFQIDDYKDFINAEVLLK